MPAAAAPHAKARYSTTTPTRSVLETARSIRVEQVVALTGFGPRRRHPVLPEQDAVDGLSDLMSTDSADAGPQTWHRNSLDVIADGFARVRTRRDAAVLDSQQHRAGA